MKFCQARSWAAVSLFLSAGLAAGCQTGKNPKGVEYAPYGASASSIEILRQQPASIALAPAPEPVAPTAVAPNPPAPTATPEAAATAPDATAAPSTEPAASATTAPEVAVTTPVAAPVVPVIPLAPPAPALNINEKLSIDLATGRTLFTDTDGRVYLLQTTPGELENLRKLVQGNSWRVGQLFDITKITLGDQTVYTATAFAADHPIKTNAQWLVTADSKIPDTVAMLHETFQTQRRQAHPLSETVNLLK